MQKAIVGGGCFWCTEAVYQYVKGVKSVISGYSAGDSENPTYKEVCSGMSGHAEVIEINFDETIITYSDILDIFWEIHNPTTLNSQGADIGTQYRSIILYLDENQKEIAIQSKAKAQLNFDELIVTKIEPLDKFYIAEEYHQNYFALNPAQGYCQAVIAPKIEKFKDKFIHFM